MYILQIYSGQNTRTGDFIYRIEQVSDGLSAIEGVTAKHLDLVDIGHPDCLTQVPLLILHHLSDPDMLPIVKLRRARGLPTVYELADNFLYSNAHMVEAKISGPPEYHLVIKELMRRCDAVQVNNARLQQLALEFNQSTLLIPNLIEKHRFGAFTEPNSSHLTVGWGGSARHFDDLEFIAAPLKQWIRETSGVRLAIMGTDSCLELFRDLPADKVLCRKAGSLDAYLAFLDKLDIGLAPLEATEFNAGRSDIKLLEYASRSVLPLCSAYGPYLDSATQFPELPMFESPQHLVEQLERLRKNEQRRRKITKKIYDRVCQSRQAKLSNWQNLFQRYTTVLSFPGQEEAAEAELEASLCNQNAAEAVNNAIKVIDKNVALTKMQEIISNSMGNYQTHYFYAWALSQSEKYEQALRQLEQACKLNPRSVRSLQLLARVQLLLSSPDDALEAIEKALDIEPDLAISANLKSVVLLAKSRYRAAYRLLKDVVHTEPDYVEARLNFARAALFIGEFFEAEIALQHLRRLVPNSAEVSYLQAMLANERGDLQQAQKYAENALHLDPAHSKSRQLQQDLIRKTKAAIHVS